jgi:hypothetical protein
LRLVAFKCAFEVIEILKCVGNGNGQIGRQLKTRKLFTSLGSTVSRNRCVANCNLLKLSGPEKVLWSTSQFSHHKRWTPVFCVYRKSLSPAMRSTPHVTASPIRIPEYRSRSTKAFNRCVLETPARLEYLSKATSILTISAWVNGICRPVLYLRCRQIRRRVPVYPFSSTN